MSLKQLSGNEMDRYERIWTRVMHASAVAVLVGAGGMVKFGSGPGLLVCGAVVVGAVIAWLAAAFMLREFERGVNESDRGDSGDLHSALDVLDD